MALGRRLRALDDNALSEFLHDQYTAPATWWWAAMVGAVALAVGLAKGDARTIAVGASAGVVGLVLSVVTRRRDNRHESGRRYRVEQDIDRRRQGPPHR